LPLASASHTVDLLLTPFKVSVRPEAEPLTFLTTEENILWEGILLPNILILEVFLNKLI